MELIPVTHNNPASALEAPIPDTDLGDYRITRGRFDMNHVARLLRQTLGEAELARMRAAGVDRRMIFGINPYYRALAFGGGLQAASGTVVLPPMPPSRPLINLVMPTAEEVADVSGEADPSNQNRYSPAAFKGKLIHKYDEIVLGHAAAACSAHCRFCYRLDLFNRTTGKGPVAPEELRDYVIRYNSAISQISSEDEPRFPITEVLLSGGDPLVMSNRLLYRYLARVAEAQIPIIRLGTKEIVFRPQRFDDNFIETLRIFNKNYPHVHLVFVFHITHPDEFLERDDQGRYVAPASAGGKFRWLPAVERALCSLCRLDFVSLHHQAAMIRGINDDPDALRTLHRELRMRNVHPHYTFQCRQMEGHKAFAVPVETAWAIHNEAQKGLSALAQSRFALSTEWGKLEVVTVTDDQIEFRIVRSPHAAATRGSVIRARRNPNALWISDYEDRITYDGRQGSAQLLAG